MKDFRKKGFLPDGMLNYLALVGWSPEDNQEILSKEELIQKFDFDRISKSGGVFDQDKLGWVNAHYIKALSNEDLVEGIRPYLMENQWIDMDYPQDKLEKLAETFRDGMHKLEDIVGLSRFLFEDLPLEEDAKEQLEFEGTKDLANAFIEELQAVDEVDPEFSKTIMKKIQKKTGIKGKNLFMPVRAMISGNIHGPEMSDIIELLGKNKLLEKLLPFGE